MAGGTLGRWWASVLRRSQSDGRLGEPHRVRWDRWHVPFVTFEGETDPGAGKHLTCVLPTAGILGIQCPYPVVNYYYFFLDTE